MVARVLLALAIAFAAAALTPSKVMACQCVPVTKPVYAGRATLVFSGTVTGVDVHRSGPFVFSSMDPVDVVFDVDTVYKGEVTRTFQVWTVESGTSCGYEFAEGHRYTVFSRLADGKFHTDLCSGTTEGPINPSSYLLSGGYPPGADPLRMLRSAIVTGILIAGGVLIVATRLRAGRHA